MKEFRCTHTRRGLITQRVTFISGIVYKGFITKNGNHVVYNEDNEPTFWFPGRFKLYFKELRSFRYGK